MKLNDNNNLGVNRRTFLKRTVWTSVTVCATPIIEKVMATESHISRRTGSTAISESRAAAISQRRFLGAGPSTLEVSAIGFGCMGLNYHRSWHPDKKAAIALVHEAIERGVNLFDTAESYGPYSNEVLMGEALKGYHGRVHITSKFGHKFVNGKRVMSEEDSSPENIRKVCEESLRRLGTETLGMFYQHRADPGTPIEEVTETVKALIKEGKVLHFGLCEVNVDTIRRAHAIQPITAIQSEYHLMHRQPEATILPLCQELGIGFVPYSPLNRGFLGGSLNEYTRFDPSNDNRPTLPRFTPEAMRANLRIVEALNSFGRLRRYAGRSTETATLAPVFDEQVWFNRFRVGRWPDYFEGVQFKQDKETLDQYFRQMTPTIGSIDFEVYSNAYAALFDKIGPAIFITHSQGGPVGWRTLLNTPNIRAIISYEPGGGLPFPEGKNPSTVKTLSGKTEGIEVPMADFMEYTKIPILIYYGDNLPATPEECPEQYEWTLRLNLARQWARMLNDLGGDVTVVHLPEAGVYGNTHFPFSDLNNIQIADMLSDYLQEKNLD